MCVSYDWPYLTTNTTYVQYLIKTFNVVIIIVIRSDGLWKKQWSRYGIGN